MTVPYFVLGVSFWLMGFLCGFALCAILSRPPRPPKGPLRDAWEK